MIFDRVRLGESIYDMSISVCYYARVSTEMDVQESSIVNQVDYFENYISSRKNWKFVEGYIDYGISGKGVMGRENFLRMIEDAKVGKFQLILTKSVSRFARNTMDSIYYTDLLLQYGVGVMFINDNINTIFPDSEFRLTLMASIAQDEIRKLSESVRFGLRQSIARGVVLGNDNLFGYSKLKGKLRIKENEAFVVRMIYQMFYDGEYCYSKIASLVYDNYHKKFDGTSIKRILTNPKYKGFYCGRKSEVVNYKSGKRRFISKDDWVVYDSKGEIPVIVCPEVWDRVNELILEKGRSNLYFKKIYCVNHQRFYKKVFKRYKNQSYCYYSCSGCFSLKKELVDKMCVGLEVGKILMVTGDEDVLVKIKLNC